MSLAFSLATNSLLPAREASESDVALSIEQTVRFEVARELHDSVAQSLAFLLVQMEDFKTRQPESSQAEVAEYQSSVRAALQNIRDVLDGLRDTRTDLETDLVELLRETIRTLSGRTGMPVKMISSPAWPSTVPAQTASHIQLIVQEALTNAAVHSEGDLVEVRMSVDDARNAILVIEDNGKGTDGRARPSHHGLAGMRERAAAMGGRLDITRGGRGGTSVRLSIPLENL